jgi:hypothetical protein
MTWRRATPTLVAAGLAAVYVITSPPSGDLPVHLLRAKLFSAEGFGIWDNWWYGGHHVVLYSVLFPAAAAALTPQLAAGLASTASAALFDVLSYARWGPAAWLGSLWFGAATATSLYTGRLAFAFGLAPAVGTALALQRRRTRAAFGAALLTALCSPVAALFAALAGAADAIGARRWQSTVVVGGALAPVALLAFAFPEGGTEPFAFSAMWPIPLIAAGVALAAAASRSDRTLVAGAVLYGIGVVVSWAVPTAIGGNSVRLGELAAGPVAALLLWPRRRALILAAAAPLLYLQWHAAVRDLTTAVGDPSTSNGYYQPLLGFLDRQRDGPFRVEIPFTRFHWETYAVAPRFPLARGWERQLDVKDNHLFYGGALTPASYRSWLDQLAVRFIGVPDATLDYSAVKEVALVDRGLPYLRLVDRTRHWRIYEVDGATPIAEGAATATAIGPNSVTLTATRSGSTLVRVRFTPYWAITEGTGCVAPEGDFTRLALTRPGPVRLGVRFSLGRIRARSARCS